MQQLAFPTFQIKATQVAVISPWCKNYNVLPPNLPIDSRADSIYLGQIHAFEQGFHHMSSCKFWKWFIFKFSNGTPGCWRIENAGFDNPRPLLQQARDHSRIFRSRSTLGSQIERKNLNSHKLRRRSFETNWEPNLFCDIVHGFLSLGVINNRDL